MKEQEDPDGHLILVKLDAGHDRTVVEHVGGIGEGGQGTNAGRRRGHLQIPLTPSYLL